MWKPTALLGVGLALTVMASAAHAQVTDPTAAPATPKASDAIVPPEIVQLENVQVDGDRKTIYVGDTQNHYVLYCYAKDSLGSCITPNEGKDYYLVTKDTHWKTPDAKKYLTLSILQDFTGSYKKGENVALLEKNADPNDHNNVGMFLIARGVGGGGAQFGSGFKAFEHFTPQDTNAASLQQQEMCGAQAKKAFEELNTNSLPGEYWQDYESHYNTKLNRCLIITHRASAKNTSEMLSDANEQHVFADFYWVPRDDKKYWEVPPVTCEFETAYGQMEHCNSQGEFNTAVAKYMDGE